MLARRHAWLVLLLTGCGLSLDLSPPDPQRIDGGRMDGGRVDGGGVDGGIDAGPCRTDLDCDDGNACSGLELCVDGACELGVPVVCPDDDVCDGTFTCDPDTGECSVEVGPLDCEGGDACSGIRSCDPVVGCVTSPGLRCDDGVECTDDRCEDGACVHVPDDVHCTDAEDGVCTADGCVYDTCDAVTCRANNPCQTARCDGDLCVRTMRECADGEECCGGECVPIGCDDDNACTRDVCVPATGCLHEPSSVAIACDDGNLCTSGDRCDGARCAAGVSSCTSSNVCLAPLCDPISGACSFGIVNGIPCSDGDPCTTNDRCSGGACVGGSEAVCDDRNPCTIESCTSLGCVSTGAPDGTVCGTALGSSGACSAGSCVANSFCVDGTSDCDGDGTCECAGVCTTNMGGLRVCTSSACTMGCPRGSMCCNLIDSREYGGCIGPETSCLSGTCCAVDGG